MLTRAVFVQPVGLVCRASVVPLTAAVTLREKVGNRLVTNFTTI